MKPDMPIVPNLPVNPTTVLSNIVRVLSSGEKICAESLTRIDCMNIGGFIFKEYKDYTFSNK